MALLCSALAAFLGHLRTKLSFLSISFGFCSEKKVPLPLYIFELSQHGLNPLNQRDVFIGHRDTGYCQCEQQQTGDNASYCNAPSSGGENLLLLMIYWGSYKLRLNAGIFNDYSESAQRSFILHWLKAHLQHAFDIRVTQGYHTVHHSSCNRSLRGRLH